MKISIFVIQTHVQMLVKTQAIVLRTIKYGDSQLITDLFTQSMGNVSFIQRMHTGKGGRVGKPYFQPLTILDIEFDERPNKQLQRIKEMRLAYPFSTIPFNSYKLSISLFLSEFLYFSVRGEHEVGALYQYVENSIRWLDSAEGAFANFHLVFMMHLTRFIGFYPNLENWHAGDFFDLRNGVFCSLVPLHPDFIPPNEAAKISQLMRMNYETMHLFRFSREERNRCANLILRYYRLHIPTFPELKSISVLQDLFR